MAFGICIWKREKCKKKYMFFNLSVAAGTEEGICHCEPDSTFRSSDICSHELLNEVKWATLPLRTSIDEW